MGCGRVIYVTASVVLGCTFLAVGISFFGPYWLSNIGAVVNETIDYAPYLWNENQSTSLYPDRGLWAQCGIQCQWFWGYDRSYKLQTKILTPLKWHVATQVLYFIGASIILFCEIINRLHSCCCTERHRCLLLAISIALFVSVLIQTAAVATFGGGASRSPYNAISDPKKFTEYLGQAFLGGGGYDKPYLGWCYWMAVVGDMLSLVSAVLFMVAACCFSASKDDYS